MTLTPQEDWIKRFDEKFYDCSLENGTAISTIGSIKSWQELVHTATKEIKDFIATEIALAEGRGRDMAIDEIVQGIGMRQNLDAPGGAEFVLKPGDLEAARHNNHRKKVI